MVQCGVLSLVGGEWRGERSGVGNDEAVLSADGLKADIN
jgi:hypothetical protein